MTCGFSVNSQQLCWISRYAQNRVQLSIKRLQKWCGGFGTIFFQHLSYIPWLQNWDVCGFNNSFPWLLDLILTETCQQITSIWIARIQRCRWFHMRKLCPPRKFPQATEGRYDGRWKVLNDINSPNEKASIVWDHHLHRSPIGVVHQTRTSIFLDAHSYPYCSQDVKHQHSKWQITVMKWIQSHKNWKRNIPPPTKRRSTVTTFCQAEQSHHFKTRRLAGPWPEMTKHQLAIWV